MIASLRSKLMDWTDPVVLALEQARPCCRLRSSLPKRHSKSRLGQRGGALIRHLWRRGRLRIRWRPLFTQKCVDLSRNVRWQISGAGSEGVASAAGDSAEGVSGAGFCSPSSAKGSGGWVVGGLWIDITHGDRIVPAERAPSHVERAAIILHNVL